MKAFHDIRLKTNAGPRFFHRRGSVTSSSYIYTHKCIYMESYLNFHRLQKEERLPFFFSLVRITFIPPDKGKGYHTESLQWQIKIQISPVDP